MGTRPSREAPRKGKHFEGTPGGVEKVSSEEYFVAASSLVRWSGSAALLGGLSTVFVDEVMPHAGLSLTRAAWPPPPVP